MKIRSWLICLLAIPLCFYRCADANTKSNALTTAGKSLFYDEGKTLDSLREAYHCESINFENWGDKIAADSCLTICLVNSTRIPPGDNADSQVILLKGIARAIKNSLRKPGEYNSYYVIFIKKEDVNGMETKAHAAGMEIPGTAL